MNLGKDPNRPIGISKLGRAEIRLTGLRAFFMKGAEIGFYTFSGPLDICASPAKEIEDFAVENLPAFAKDGLYSFYVEDRNNTVYVVAELIWK